MAQVEVAQTAFVRANLGTCDQWIRDANAIVSKPLRLEEEIDIRPVGIREFAVVGASLLHQDLAIRFEQCRRYDPSAFRADRFGLFRKPFWECTIPSDQFCSPDFELFK